MKLFYEIHTLTNRPPSCLNRDDLGNHKNTVYGGYRRAYISSQCQKKASADYLKTLIAEGKIGLRTDNIVKAVVDKAAKTMPELDVADLQKKVCVAITAAGFAVDKDTFKSPVIFYLSQGQIQSILTTILDHQDSINWENAWEKIGKDKKAKKAKKTDNEDETEDEKKSSSSIPSKFVNAIKASIEDHCDSVDQALRGRMLANLPRGSIAAAYMTAPEISINEFTLDQDYYVSHVDDPEPGSGAKNLGHTSFGSFCGYHYGCVSADQYLTNLNKTVVDDDIATELGAWLESVVKSQPSAKQTTMAAYSFPSVILVPVRRNSGPYSLAKAFERPVRPHSYGDKSLTRMGVDALVTEYQRVDQGFDGLLSKSGTVYALILEEGVELPPDVNFEICSSFGDLLSKVKADLLKG